ncbi:NAD(P)-dependent dehydrogenase (short-subunit alcohol dehydrogenase family) [Pedobacter cryoconitis]|uniref:NAD(P)-dependent dehydrogenase (Short-subunit alcohol dehydrogenase family) n=1 Tax=Pedobacter cryoconitis TaxID=188932 RepID=A0A7W8ZQG9_9SPHI|nr:SDR family NAD(P)-dependent oxidoreductase [Pedobacter cryoconitis]MBB5638145.1 NAD(P)-dependent dehydrogenase (short-subunit alcohol dehydrogenase family) [Pedobacter cryoconitis]
MKSKVILITGASRGLGRIWAEAFLKRGDKVVATARNIDSLNDLVATYGEAVLPVKLNVNDRDQCFDIIHQVDQHFGGIDVLINNAGYGLFGAIEETTEQEARDQIETNVFGLLWMTQAIIPVMRRQHHGHIIQISSVLGIAATPVLGIYNASKWAMEGLSESLAAEVKRFGINVSIVEPNAFGTDWSGGSAVKTEPIAFYDDIKEALNGYFKPGMTGNPETTAPAILKLVDSEKPPLRLLLGKHALSRVQQVYADRLAVWDSWKEVSVAAHGH